MDLITTAAATTDLVAKLLDSLRERAKASRNAELKENVSNVYDRFLDLKEIVVRLKEENAELRRALSAQAEKPPKPEIRQVGETNYYFVGDQGPYCQPCYDNSGKLVNLTPQQHRNGGIRRRCEVCDKVFFEMTPHTRAFHVH